MELPAHRESDDGPETGHGQAATTGWATWLVLAVIVALVALVVIAHLTGVVGPRAH